MKIKLNHVGFITKNLEKFERFWCEGLGFKADKKREMNKDKAYALFGYTGKAIIIHTYTTWDRDITIEIHEFPDVDLEDSPASFNTIGINHICLHVENRIKFLKELIDKLEFIEVRKFWDDNNGEGGWWNIFIRDFDGNWIELRETLPSCPPVSGGS